MKQFSPYFPFLDPSVVPVSVPFYDLAGLPGLRELPRTQDSHSGPIFLPGSASLLYGDELITKIYVSTCSN